MVSLGLAAPACSRPERSQIVVTVAADAEVAELLSRLDVLIYPEGADETDSRLPAHSFPIKSQADTTEARAFALPFSFGISGPGGRRVRIVIQGRAEGGLRAPILIERKLLARFQSSAVVGADVYLDRACFGEAHVCSDFEHTCYGEASAGVAVGKCGRVVSAELRDLTPGEELNGVMNGPPVEDEPAETPSVPEAGELVDMDAGTPLLDTGIDDIFAFDAAKLPEPLPWLGDAGALEVDPGLPPCLTDSGCDPAYPCVRGTTSGFSCLGQFAEWPMPGDRDSGAKFSDSFSLSAADDYVADRVTGLVWATISGLTYRGCTGKLQMRGDTCSWDEAARFCASLKIGAGQGRARLPSKIELESITDETRSGATAFYPAFFITPSGSYWTRSPVVGSPGKAWVIGSSDGEATAEPIASSQLVRCVRSEPTLTGTPEERYSSESATKTVTDTRTKLVWQQANQCGVTSPGAAAALCAGLGSRFRLPTHKELLTLVDPTLRSPAVSPVFSPTDAKAPVWTATHDSKQGYLLVHFADGHTQSEEERARNAAAGFTESACVRCVHD
jgi:hypothetical protein